MSRWCSVNMIRRDDYLPNSSINLVRVDSLKLGFNLHSQIAIICQPKFISSCCLILSFSIVFSIFSSHHSVLVFGTTKYLHPSWPCQKHPFIKITVLYFGKTISGFPGNFLTCSLYLNPLANKNRLTTISGFVSLPLIRLIL